MVRAYIPQGRNTSVETNTNFPPQGSEAAPDTGTSDMLFENGINKMSFENGNFMEYET